MFEPLCPLHYEATQRLLETLGSAPRMETGMSLVPADREETPPVDDGAGSELAGSGGGEAVARGERVVARREQSADLVAIHSSG